MSALHGSVLSKMGHELRSPLNGIIGLTRIMQMKHAAGSVDAAQQLRQLDMVQTSAQRLLATIERLTDIAKIESGGLQPHWESVDCGALVARATRPELVLDTPDEPVVVSSDPKILTKLLSELIDNAVRFTRSAPGAVRVRVHPAAGAGAALIAVEDDGPGIPDSERARIFEAFERGENAAEYGDGSGLGLYLAFRLAGLLGAQLDVHSGPGGGSSFTVSIPAAEPQGA